MGRLELSYDDLYDLTPRSFNNKLIGWNETFESKSRDSWERARLLNHSILSPHLKKKTSPDKLLPLPWDKERKVEKKEIASKEHIKNVLEKYKNKTFKKL